MDFSLASPVARLVPEPVAALQEVLLTCWATLDPVDLELVRLRVAQLLGDERGFARRTPEATAAGLTETRIGTLDQWWSASVYTDREQALLGFVDQFVFSVGSMTDEDVEALLATDSPIRVHELANAVWAFDLSTRLELVSRAVLA